MGLNDRDYMRRAGEDEPRGGAPADEQLEAVFSGFLRRHPRLPLVIVLSLVALVILSILLVKFG